MGELIVVTGPPGAGKSTVARAVSAGFNPGVLVTGDSFFGFLDQGTIAPWLAGSEAQNDVVTEAAALAAGRFARADYTVVYDGMIGPWYLHRFRAAADVPSLHYVVLLPDEATCLQRVASRTGHGFTDLAATRTMHAQFLAAEIDERHVLAPPPHDPAQTAALIRHRLAEGRLLVAS